MGLRGQHVWSGSALGQAPSQLTQISPPFAFNLLQVMLAQNTPSQGVVFHIFTLLSHYHLNWYGVFKSVMKPYGKCRRFTIISDIINTFTSKWVNTCIEVVFECYVMLQPCCKTKKRQEKRTWHRPIFNDFFKKKKKSTGMLIFDQNWRFCWCFPGMKLALCGCRLESQLVNSPVLLSEKGGGGVGSMHNGLSQGGLELCP